MTVIPTAKCSPLRYRGADCAVKMNPIAAPAESSLVSNLTIYTRGSRLTSNELDNTRGECTLEVPRVVSSSPHDIQGSPISHQYLILFLAEGGSYVEYKPMATMNTPKNRTPGFGLAIRMIYPIKADERAIRIKVERFFNLSE